MSIPEDEDSLATRADVDSTPQSPQPDQPGVVPQMIGRYRVVKLLGEGGFGRVFLAQDDDLDRPVAIKVPRPDRISRPEDVEAYLTEARTLARLDHPAIVPVLDVGRTGDGLCFVVSKYIEGTDLAGRLKQGAFSPHAAASLIATVADALHYAHSRHLVHRDVKPANILIDASGKASLADFGLALKEENFGKGSGMAGTPAYMSPEQARGEGHRVDGRSDVYSLGVVFYELLTGRRPFQGDSIREILEKITESDARPPRQFVDSIPREIERICLKALSKRATDRYSTAGDLAEDLQVFLKSSGSSDSPPLAHVLPSLITPPGSTVEATPVPREAGPSDSDLRPIKIVPKGLRSFDEHDADFFLELLPGARDRDGLPEGLRFWKTRIEIVDPDKTFKVGLIYGPSGCGKSSIMKAGLIPRLSKHVHTVYIEATPEETESRLLRGLRKVCHELPPSLGLVDAISSLRRGRLLGKGRKVLLVLDQFEQWLFAKRSDQDTELVAALRQCDGEHVQAIVMVRDDFWMAATRLMRDLEIRLVEGENSAAVDLFDPRHATKLLTAFGQAYGALPENPSDFTPEHKAFTDQSVTGLAQDGKVISVRLALFAEMVKGKPWTPATLREVGGTQGVGVTFLEETFSATTAPPEHRLHQKAAQAVLKALLPETGTNIKGEMKSEAELREASGYANRPRDFDDLIQILDAELRLITPTDPEGSANEVQANRPAEGRYYHFTHDYLVPSLREWLTRKQRETRRGRAELKLAERSATWNAKPENRLLPSVVEWASIRSSTRQKDWTEPQRRMMRRAGRVHGVRGLTLAVVLLLVAWGGYEVNGRLNAQMLRDKLLGSPLSDTPSIIAELNPYRTWVDPLLRRAFAEAKKAGDSQKQLHAALALLPVDETQLPYLKDRLLRADAREISVIRQSLAGHKDSLVPECWRMLQNPTQDDQGKALQAASALALYDPENPLWETIRIDVANRLVAENSFVVSRWVDALRPVARPLIEPLAVIFRDEKRSEIERTLAASALAEYVTGQPGVLAGLLMDATEKQFVTLYPGVERQSEQTSPFLEVELSQKPPSQKGEKPTDEDNKAWDRFYKRQANAAVALIRMGRTDKSWSLLKESPDPSLRSYLVHRLGPLGYEAGSLIARLDQESDISIRRALILSLGEVGKGRISTTDRDACTKKLIDLYRNDPDPGIHGASEWLLRQWRNESQIQGIDKELGKLPLPTSKENNRRWYINSQGQTMVIVPASVPFEMGEGGTRHRVTISHSFAIASKEVTVEQFETFLKENPENPRVQFENQKVYSPVPTCPMNSVSWYDATAYCNWLSKKEGIPEVEWYYGPNEQGEFAEGMKVMSNPEKRKGYRLPTEAEWEFSCRAGTSTGYSFGEPWELLEKYGRYDENSSSRTQPVGGLKPNDFGLFDLHGNGWEWCQDRHEQPKKENKSKDNIASEYIYDNNPRFLRGGSFIYRPTSVRSAVRSGFAPSYRSLDYGFRPSRTYH